MKKNTVRKILSAVVASFMLLSLSGCGDKNTADGGESENGSDSTEQTPYVNVVNDEIRDIPSTELVKEIKIGWNLGNTLDSNGGTGVDSETSWGNVLTTKEMITTVKNSGFNIIRIPTTWGIHMDENNVVDEAWMNRVQEVVDYAYSQDMFVILNIHHEEWHDPYYETEAEATEKLKALWTQIGTRFAGYNEKLIFEGLNEPRKRNTGVEWNGGDDEGREVVNHFNAAFVETIRGLGGNNAKRHLMIPGYAASSTDSALKAIKVPEGDDKIIISVHAYTPYAFALSDDFSARKFSPDDPSANDIIYLMDTLKTTFIDKGTPVIIGEFGARAKANEDIRG
ncbi:MAG: glycoside hydrolase family 5 protein, partial [Oscillospiraceae bacterium]|nr:glycoside hydrolase family 5 protein [Oscillospiraceae bacterium]